MRFSLFISSVIAAIFISTCAYASSFPTRYSDGSTISADTAWHGRVEVDGVVFVPEGVTLTILPGTVVAFSKSRAAYREDGEGGASEVLIPGSGIRVEGRVVAEGTKAGNVIFTSAQKSPAPGDWGCIFLDHSKGSVFRRCRFEYSTYTLHSHFSSFDVSWSKLTKNEDGSRLGTSRVGFDHCDITGNAGKGLNFRQCRNTVTNCNITGNHEGIFLNEKDAACVIENNNIQDNEGMDLRMGEFHSEDVTLKNNWWGTVDLAVIKKHVYDKDDDPAIGRAVIEPAAAEVAGAGADTVSIKVLWKYKTGGYVDSMAAFSNGVVFFGSWDKSIYAVKADTGEPVWSFKTGDCVDSSPAIFDGMVVFGSWDRNIYCLDEKDGRLLWKFVMPPSNFDDHRQASPVINRVPYRKDNTVYMGGFNCKIYALDLNDGHLRWEFTPGGAIRSRPLLVGERLLLGAGDGGFYALHAVEGGLQSSFKAGGAVNTSPAAMEGRVYFGSRDGKVYCLDGKDGKLIWSYQTGGSIEYSSPLVAGNDIMVGSSDGKLYALDRIVGSLKWVFDCGAAIYSSPLLVSGAVVVGDNGGGVRFLEPDTGGQLGVFRAGDAVQSLSAGPDGVVYAGSRDGFLYALAIGE